MVKPRSERAIGPPRIDDDAQTDVSFVETLYRSEAQGLHRHAIRRLSNSHDAHDLVHDFFSKLLRLSRPWSEEDQPKAYARRSISNLSINRNSAERSRTAALSDFREISNVAALDPHAQLEARDDLRLLEGALAQLPERSRLIFLAIRLEGLSYAEVAVHTGLSVKRVEKVMRKAVSRIDHMLDRT